MRDRWSSRMIFIFAAVGSAVGLGNVWRFPYLVGKYGGGAFLVPYLLILFSLGLPLLIMEFAIGQKFQRGAVGSFYKIHPKLSGIGLLSALCGFVVTCYYTVVMAWSLLYVLKAPKLAWGEDTQSYFLNKVLNLSSGVSEMGHIVIPIFISLIICWILVYFSVWKGVKSVGKVIMVTMPLPVIILVILAIRGLSLDGASQGLLFYAKPQFTALLDLDVWRAALTQIFFTLTIGFGVMIAYASFNDEKSDIAKDGIVTALLNSAISLVAGVSVFTTLGYMSLRSGVPIEELAKSGPSLAFIVFPKALSLIPGAPFFAVLFFIMLVTLAIDSAFSMVEAMGTILEDAFPKIPKPKIILYISLVGFLGGILFTTQAGLYYLDIVDHFITSFGLVIVGLLQCLVIGWYYGAEKLRAYINEVSEINIGRWWSVCIKYIIPILLMWMLVASFVEDTAVRYENHANWALNVFGWGVVGVVIFIAVAFSCMYKQNDTKET